MKFFFDNNLSPRIAKGLNALVSPEHEVIHLKDLFPQDTEDVVWMEKLAQRQGLIIITGDVRIGRNPQEIAAWKQSKHTIFFLKRGWINMKFWDQAQKFIKCFPLIIELSESEPRGSSFIITVNVKIERC